MKNRSRRSIYILLFLAGICGLLSGIVLAYWTRNLPPVESLEYFKPDIVTQIFDDEGKIIGEFFTERRIYLSRSEIPDRIVKALLAAEDSGFYDHPGFDFPGIARAVLKDLVSFKKAQGASTITQQLARMLFLTNEKTFARKMKEALLALEIERRYPKDDILTLYLNQIYFGHGAYGIESAAQTFFRKNSADLTNAQCALLISVLKNPTIFSPIHHPERSLESRNRVLKRMQDAKFITPEEFDEGAKEPLGVIDEAKSTKVGSYFLEEVRKYLVERLGNERVLTGGLKVYTTLNQDHQKAAEFAAMNGLRSFIERHPDGTDIQTALVAIKPDTGDITAMLGGTDFTKTKFNRAMQAKRQSGSTIKPFIYYTALHQGISPSDLYLDEPYEYVDPQSHQVWRPQNYDHQHHGPMTVRTALEQSNNIVTLKLLEKVGIPAVKETAKRAGIQSELPSYMSLGLGTGEVSLLELTSAYGTLAAGGMRARPRFIKSVTDTTGTILEKNNTKIEETLDAKICCILTGMLQGAVEHGTAWRVRSLNQKIAAKTGTTDDYSDAWFVGYTPDISIGVWVGFDLKKTMGSGETGSKTAGPIFESFAKQIFTDVIPKDNPLPDGISESKICIDSGLLASDACPVTIKERYLSGTEPRKKCMLHSTSGSVRSQ